MLQFGAHFYTINGFKKMHSVMTQVQCSNRVCEDIKNQMFHVILNGWTQVSAGTSIRLNSLVAFPVQFCGTTAKACCSRADSVSVCGDVPEKADSI